MDDMHGIRITSRDRLLRAWTNEMELVRDYQLYSHETEDEEELQALFAQFAEDAGHHAAELSKRLHKMQA